MSTHGHYTSSSPSTASSEEELEDIRYQDHHKKKEKREKRPTKKKKYERIDELPLHDNIGGGMSANTSVSVLGGVVRIERAEDKAESYRIVAAFHLQVKIHSFEKGYFKTHNRLFDFISLRYLYHKDERHEVLPNAYPLTKKVGVTEESAKTGSMTAGVSATAPAPTLTPNLSVQVGREQKITVQRDIGTWRRGLSYESWYARRRSRPAEYHGEKRTQRRAHHQHKFLVQTQHRDGCACLRHPENKKCRLREGGHYTRCVHWFWQVEATPHLWVPEIYESVNFPITVTRIISRDKIAEMMHMSHEKQPLMHFDFVLTTRLRELGWSLRDKLLPWRPRRPAEIRAKTDSGYPLGTEKVIFCITACPQGIKWPGAPTRSLQRSAEEGVSARIHHRKRITRRGKH